MSRKHRTFDTDFKLEVAKMVKDQGISVSQVCRDLKLGDAAVRRGVQQYETERLGDGKLGKPSTAEQQRIREFEQQVRDLKMARTTL
ncbi:transposase [Azomonas agilis]|uniref:Transposase n=1 Tax=Azomonas agilis TaxID=116849 RepID=A0A562I354_9GAMM|nr:transposase [Azomonas agilis]TWH65053.1 transposase [Azomonas agilis]